ncbi:amidohydrolase family protein [Halomonas sp. GT]|uniref:amidohydrolase family protein n=1 Tax=Halomonas sp. GT TaxID=1971364 RepID=UPI0009F1DB84|nr:amidohydrolase family protein [Halomonas sp. GT]
MSNVDISRRTLLALGMVSVVTPALGRSLPVILRQNEEGPFDTVLIGGRVIDPETGLDAIRNVGIKGERIAAISETPLKGDKTLDASGLIVAPGFIDLHAHGQQLPAAWMQAFDGVTTALELESGLLPIAQFYDKTAAEGRPINYGASVAWTYARIAEKEGIEPDGTLQWFQQAFSLDNWQNTLATPDELERIISRVESGLQQGGIGIGINAGYAPGYGRKEYYALAQLAAQYEVPTFTHVRSISVVEPLSAFEALQELVALAAATGAHMHVCHLNSSAGRDIEMCAELLKGAQERGLPISIEAYPYGAGSSAVGAEIYRGNWLERWGAPDPTSLELDGVPLTQAKIDELQASEPGAVVVMHFLRPDDSEEDQRLLDLSVLYPGSAIASDAMPWAVRGSALTEDVWPLPEGAFAHPRSSGCYARFISQWVRDRQVISLSEALAKTSLIPAQILEASTPQMRTKGRLQVGADADIVIFDLAELQDQATFLEPARPSTGVMHLIVNGTPVILSGVRQENERPGQAIRRPIG